MAALKDRDFLISAIFVLSLHFSLQPCSAGKAVKKKTTAEDGENVIEVTKHITGGGDKNKSKSRTNKQYSGKEQKTVNHWH